MFELLGAFWSWQVDVFTVAPVGDRDTFLHLLSYWHLAAINSLAAGLAARPFCRYARDRFVALFVSKPNGYRDSTARVLGIERNTREWLKTRHESNSRRYSHLTGTNHGAPCDRRLA